MQLEVSLPGQCSDWDEWLQDVWVQAEVELPRTCLVGDGPSDERFARARWPCTEWGDML